jgi:hypothetical protein
MKCFVALFALWCFVVPPSMLVGQPHAANVAVAIGLGLDENDHCSPAEIQADPTAGCVRALTWCICVASGGGSISTYGDCEGCHFVVSGVVDCSFSSQPPSSHPFNCSTSLPCGGWSTCGARCPCTGGAYFPLILKCGDCTEF